MFAIYGRIGNVSVCNVVSKATFDVVRVPAMPFKFPHDSVVDPLTLPGVKCERNVALFGHPSHFLNSIESGGFISTVSLPTSFQLVDSTVPLLSCFCV